MENNNKEIEKSAYMSASAAARYLGVTRQALYQAQKRGSLKKTHKVADFFVFTTAEIKRYKKNNAGKTGRRKKIKN